MFTQTNSEPVPEGPKLPYELLNIIIDESRDNKASLQQLSLVCHSFCQQARYHLFRSIQITCELPSEPYQYEDNEVDSSPNDKKLTIDEFIRLCENPHSTWNPRVVKKLVIYPHADDGILMLLSASDFPQGLPTAKLDAPRTREIFGSLESLQLSFSDMGNWHRIGVLPCEFISKAFPSIRRLSLKFVQFSDISDLWYTLISVPLLEEFEWIGGASRYWSPTLGDVRIGPLPTLRSFSFQGSEDISLRDLMPVISRLPMSHLRRYEFRLADRDDFPAISTLMTMADSDGPAKQQWSFAFLPNASTQTGAYTFENSEDLDFVAGQLCLTQNRRISELSFGNASAWPVVPELLQRFVTMSLSKSNLESIMLPPFMVGKWSMGFDIFTEMERIDEILDDDAFSGLQELRLHSFATPESNGDAPPDTAWPLDGRTRSIRWGRFEPMLEDIEGRCVSRAVKRGIWKLRTVGK